MILKLEDIHRFIRESSVARVDKYQLAVEAYCLLREVNPTFEDSVENWESFKRGCGL